MIRSAQRRIQCNDELPPLIPAGLLFVGRVDASFDGMATSGFLTLTMRKLSARSQSTVRSARQRTRSYREIR